MAIEHDVIVDLMASGCRVAMLAEQTQTQITFPVEVDRSWGAAEIVWLHIISKILESRLLRLLRFK